MTHWLFLLALNGLRLLWESIFGWKGYMRVNLITIIIEHMHTYYAAITNFRPLVHQSSVLLALTGNSPPGFQTALLLRKHKMIFKTSHQQHVVYMGGGCALFLKLKDPTGWATSCWMWWLQDDGYRECFSSQPKGQEAMEDGYISNLWEADHTTWSESSCSRSVSVSFKLPWKSVYIILCKNNLQMIHFASVLINALWKKKEEDTVSKVVCILLLSQNNCGHYASL